MFFLKYSPARRNVHFRGDNPMKSSLCIVQNNAEALTFRHSFFIKRNDGEFVQWGETCEENYPHHDTEDWSFGPDNEPESEPTPAAGIFGLSHQELLRSEWVKDDALTVKVKLELREQEDMETSSAEPQPPCIELPPPTITTDLLAQLDGANESGGDVTFFVEGERLRAHALILCARSEVFRLLLSGSMREAASREVTIEECDAVTFRAMLRYLYTDDLVAMEEWVKERAAESSGGGGEGGEGGTSDDAAGSSEHSPAGEVTARMALLQRVLAASHCYQVGRLRLWCEKQLAETVNIANVCGCLCQAHLFEAKVLEEACLDFISTNHAKVSITKEFGRLGAEWPTVMLKVVHKLSGVEAAEAAPALEAATTQGNKRKRGHEL